MILIFSIVLYPIFFIISYAIAEYIYPTKNGAMFFSFLAAFVISYLYYTIRSKVRQLTEKKKAKKRTEESQLVSLLFADYKNFKEKFPENALTDNSFSGVDENKISFFKHFKHLVKINKAFTKGNFLTDVIRVSRGKGIFNMDAFNVWVKCVNCINGVAVAIKNYVGGIEVSKKIICADFLNNS